SQFMKASPSENTMGTSVKIAKPRRLGRMKEYATRFLLSCLRLLLGLVALLRSIMVPISNRRPFFYRSERRPRHQAIGCANVFVSSFAGRRMQVFGRDALATEGIPTVCSRSAR